MTGHLNYKSSKCVLKPFSPSPNSFPYNILSSAHRANKLTQTLRINPYLTNGFSHYCHLGESIINFSGVWSEFDFFLFHFSLKILQANRIAPDGTPRFAASHLGLCCLPMSHKRDARLK